MDRQRRLPKVHTPTADLPLVAYWGPTAGWLAQRGKHMLCEPELVELLGASICLPRCRRRLRFPKVSAAEKGCWQRGKPCFVRGLDIHLTVHCCQHSFLSRLPRQLAHKQQTDCRGTKQLVHDPRGVFPNLRDALPGEPVHETNASASDFLRSRTVRTHPNHNSLPFLR